MAAVNHAHMLGDHMAFRSNDETIRIDPQADRPIGERGWNTVAVALEVDQTGRRNARLVCSTKPSKGDGTAINCICSSTQASATVPANSG